MDIKVLASGSAGNCYRISDGDTSLLLDAGISIKRIREGCGYNLRGISGCLVTHSHGDHTRAVRDLLAVAVPVYMPQGEIDAMGLPAHHRLHPLSRLSVNSRVYPTFSIGTLAILPFRTEHDTPEPVGYLIAARSSDDKLLYFTDSFYLAERFSGLTHIIGEVNYDSPMMWKRVEEGTTPPVRAKRLFGTHMSLDTFLDFIRSVEHPETIRQIFICHMSDDHGDAPKTLDAVRRLTGAEVYLC